MLADYKIEWQQFQPPCFPLPLQLMFNSWNSACRWRKLATVAHIVLLCDTFTVHALLLWHVRHCHWLSVVWCLLLSLVFRCDIHCHWFIVVTYLTVTGFLLCDVCYCPWFSVVTSTVIGSLLWCISLSLAFCCVMSVTVPGFPLWRPLSLVHCCDVSHCHRLLLLCWRTLSLVAAFFGAVSVSLCTCFHLFERTTKQLCAAVNDKKIPG